MYMCAVKKEFLWLENVRATIDIQQNLEEGKCISWAGYHSNLEEEKEHTEHAISSLLPLFPDESKSIAMIRHAVDMIRQAVTHLNLGQVSVIALDQPLYAVAKKIQWNWPESYGEQHVVMMFGGLYINDEMAFLGLLGHWLEGLGKMASTPQFQFWYIMLQLELMLLLLIRSLREANFQLYVDTLSEMIPWFFALDHVNYSRWLPIHLC